MRRRFWRNEQVGQARRALEGSKRERSTVERLAHDLTSRRGMSYLVPVVIGALRRGE